MKRVLLIPLFVFAGVLFFYQASSSIAILPVKNDHKVANSRPLEIPELKIKDLEKVTGKKLSLKQKIELKILKFSLRKKLFTRALQKKETDKGELALILSIIGIVTLFIPYFAIVSLPCAIAALIIGYSARNRDPSNKKAKTAIILGWVTIAVFIVALLILIAVLSTFAWY